MRQIKYILVNATLVDPAHPYTVSNLGHHFVINSQGMLLNPIDISNHGSFVPKPAPGQEDLNQCAIGIKYNGNLSDHQLRPLLISLLLDLRDHFPSAKILGLTEYDRYHIHISEDMNQLRRELSDFL